MTSKYSVMFSGRVCTGQTPDAVKARLAALFRVKASQLDALFRGGPVALKRGLDEPTGRKWLAVLEKNGALCWLEQEHTQNAPPKPVTIPVLQVTAAAGMVPPQAEPAVENASVQEPDSRAVKPRDPEPEVESVAVHTGARVSPEPPVARFVKCPKCGRLAATIDDELMTGGECPSCGLLTEKYAKTCVEGAEPVEHVAPSPGRETQDSPLFFWQAADWPPYVWGAILLSLFSMSLPGLMYDFSLYGSWLSGLELARSGLLTAVAVFAVSAAAFACRSLYRASRRVFKIASLCSLGFVVVLALLGFLLELVFRFVGAFVGTIGLHLNPQRSILTVLAPFPIVLACAVLVRFPAEQRLTTFLDGEEYTTRVEEAKLLAGPDFPSGSRHLKYEYYKFVYVKPSLEEQPSFEKTLSKLLPDYRPNAGEGVHSSEVDVLVLNAIRFAAELEKDGLISRETAARLTQRSVRASASRPGK